MKWWTLAACLLATALFAVALRADVYEVTSPPAWSSHVFLRKVYSIVAFTLVGYAARRAAREHGVVLTATTTVVGTAAYSGLIEVGQSLNGSQEGLAWSLVDVACGAVGGVIALTADKKRGASS